MSTQSLGEMASADRRIVVSVDMGTRFSSIAWAEMRNPDLHYLIDQWPSGMGEHGGVMSSKVPTELRYTDSGTQWGYQIAADVERSTTFKQQFRRESSDSLPPPYQLHDEDTLVSDYLAALLDHLMLTLGQNLGTSLGKAELEFCLAVPSNWSEISKQKYLKDFQKSLKTAGLNINAPISLVTESEATTKYALQGLFDLQPEDTFVLCDAGGEGVTVTSYMITSLHPTVQLKECISGTREEYGSAEINQRFCDFLTSKLRREPGWSSEVLNEAMRNFEIVKKRISPSKLNGREYSILVPGLSDNDEVDIKGGKVRVESSELFDIFEPAINKVIRLVEGQIKSTEAKAKAILLVGGFGQNNYLNACLRDSIDHSIDILRPANGGTAVARGGLLVRANRERLQTPNQSSLAIHPGPPTTTPSMTGSRIATHSYGYQAHILFDPKLHDESRKFWWDNSKTWRVNAMTWFVRKGDIVRLEEPYIIGQELSISFPCSSSPPKTFAYYIFGDSISVVPPVHKTATVSLVAKLNANLAMISDEEWSQHIVMSKAGEKIWHLPFAIEVVHYTTTTRFSFVACGKRLASVLVGDA